jgi:hypothetical protein
LPAFADTVTLPFGNGEHPLVKMSAEASGDRLTSRPPQLETPFSVFDENVITPNDAFFVRYHLADIPLTIDPVTFYWMKSAYRISENVCACVEPGTARKATAPIKRLNVRSFITNLADGPKVEAGSSTLVKGIAYDGGRE